MKLTNRSGLPEILVRAIQNDTYSKGKSDYSATGLLKPPRIAHLTRKHWNEIEEDVEERLWALYGQIAHLIIERSGAKNDITEDRYFTEVNGKTISAQVDHLCLSEDALTDWKFTTAWKFKSNSLPDKDWEAQLNIQAYILRKNGLDPKKLQIVGLLRDYSKAESFRNQDYPKHAVCVQDIQDWGMDKTEEFIKSRIDIHEKAKLSPPNCTPEERWETKEVWAHMKNGRKSALKLYYTPEGLPELGVGEYIQHRKGEPKRCALYCPVSKFCEQYQSEVKHG